MSQTHTTVMQAQTEIIMIREDCAKCIDGIGYGWLYTQITNITKRCSQKQPVRVDSYPKSVDNKYNKLYSFARVSYTLCWMILCTWICLYGWFICQTMYFCPDEAKSVQCIMLYIMLYLLCFDVLWASTRQRICYGYIDGWACCALNGENQPATTRDKQISIYSGSIVVQCW